SSNPHRKRSSSVDQTSIRVQERASRPLTLNRRVSFQSPTPLRSSFSQPEYVSPTRRTQSPNKRVTFGRPDIQFDMLSPALLKMSIKRSSMSNPAGVAHWMPNGEGSASFPSICEEVNE
ncbi:hypothetical protein PFISCL1PPCAC_29102, partial [Pristionchus fissidentatus]